MRLATGIWQAGPAQKQSITHAVPLQGSSTSGATRLLLLSSRLAPREQRLKRPPTVAPREPRSSNTARLTAGTEDSGRSVLGQGAPKLRMAATAGAGEAGGGRMTCRLH